MPIISSFPGMSGSGGGGGIVLGAVSGITTKVASGKVFVKWTDPEDIVVSDITLAAWGGTLLVRKAGSAPQSRRDGTVVLDSKTRNAYSSAYFTDSGLSDGTVYYYKFFPYTTAGAYTDSADDEFTATPTAQVAGIDSWNVTSMSASTEAGNGKMTVKWTDPAATITSDGVTLASWGSTTVVVKAGSYPTSKDDSAAAYRLKVTTRNQYSSSALTVTGLTNGTTYYIGFYPETTDGGINNNTSQRTTGVANRITISTVPSQSGTLTYNGNTQSPSWSNYNSAKMTLGGTTSASSAGSYNATFTPTTDYRWSDGTTTAKTVSWSIGKATVSTVPSQSGTLTYTGSAQSPSWSNYSSSSLTLGGTTSGTNAGSYNATFTPTSNYKWSDNTTTAKTVAWSIGKADGSLTLNKTTLSVDEGGTGTITVTRSGDGAITATSSATGTATVSVSGTTITVTGKAEGSATITVSVAAGTNYTAPANKTCAVTVKSAAPAGATASTSAQSGVTYTDGLSGIAASDVTIFAQAISNNSAITSATSTVYVDYGDVHRKISVGDQVALSLNGTSYNFDVIGFNHDTLTTATAYGSATATGKAGITFQMHDLFATTYPMNSSNTNTGGWKSSVMRTSTMVTMKGYLPSAWQTAIKAVNKISGVGGGSSSGTETVSDSCFLLAEIEIFGSTAYSVSGEGTQYAYYSAGNSKVKTKSGSARYWWERSPLSGDSYNFCGVVSSGDADYSYASDSYGVAFGFCV